MEVDDATVCPSISVSACVYAFVHVSACIFIVYAGSEAAVLDWYRPEADPGIRNDDQSLSPVTPLVSSLFLSFLIP